LNERKRKSIEERKLAEKMISSRGRGSCGNISRESGGVVLKQKDQQAPYFKYAGGFGGSYVCGERVRSWKESSIMDTGGSIKLSLAGVGADDSSKGSLKT